MKNIIFTSIVIIQIVHPDISYCNDHNYKWFTEHRDSLLTMISDTSASMDSLLDDLYTVWVSRDGAIFLEISDFIYYALFYHTENMLSKFEENEFSSFIQEIDVMYLTDFSGNNRDTLLKKRDAMVLRLKLFIQKNVNSSYLNRVNRLRIKFENANYREVD